MTIQAVVEVDGIVKELGQGAGMVRALKGVSMSLNPGELTLLMGPSGSGKTTLLSILGCILTPTEGHITIAGEKTDGLSPEGLADLRRRHVGFVFQSYNLFPTLNALENVRLSLDVRGEKYADTVIKAETALREVGLAHRLRSFPGNMSGGEQQRVAIARSMANDPEVLLADEPTGNLDTTTGKQIMALLTGLHSQGKTIVLVTHNPMLADHATHRLYMRDGVIERLEEGE